MSLPVVRTTNKEALIALLRSGAPYIAESEISPSRIVTRFYKPDAEYAVAEMTLEGDHVGTNSNILTCAMAGDEGAQQELAAMHAPEAAHAH